MTSTPTEPDTRVNPFVLTDEERLYFCVCLTKRPNGEHQIACDAHRAGIERILRERATEVAGRAERLEQDLKLASARTALLTAWKDDLRAIAEEAKYQQEIGPMQKASVERSWDRVLQRVDAMTAAQAGDQETIDRLRADLAATSQDRDVWFRTVMEERTSFNNQLREAREQVRALEADLAAARGD